MSNDNLNFKILETLRREGRASFSRLATLVGLSIPAVTDRIRRMEADGVIRGYAAMLDPARLGWTVSGFATVTPDRQQRAAFEVFARDHPQIRECHRMTGRGAYLAKLVARDMADLSRLTDRLDSFGTVDVSIVLDTITEEKPLPLADGGDVR